MGRTRTFDEAEVLTASAAVFRSDGYEGTSIDRLVSATGVHRGSVYATFGSKRGLFTSALGRAAASETTTDELLDLLLVALLEVAAGDATVHRIVSDTLRDRHITPETLGRRILGRAGVHEHSPKEES